MSIQSVNSSNGYYGKTPNHGDFIQHNCPREFIDCWDDWLQTSIAHSKVTLGDLWLDFYLTSPIYRFVLSKGLSGENAWLGTLMPSVDKVGRYYPFTVFSSTTTDTNPFTLLERNERWFRDAEALSLSVLEDEFNIDNLFEKLNNLPEITKNSETGDSPLTKSTSEPAESILLRDNFQSIQPIRLNYINLLNSVLLETCNSFSVFTTSGSENVKPSVLISQGLPLRDGTTALLDGDWEKWGWLNCEQNHPEDDSVAQTVIQERPPWETRET